MLYYIKQQNKYLTRGDLRTIIGTQAYNKEKEIGSITYINDREFVKKVMPLFLKKCIIR